MAVRECLVLRVAYQDKSGGKRCLDRRRGRKQARDGEILQGVYRVRSTPIAWAETGRAHADTVLCAVVVGSVCCTTTNPILSTPIHGDIYFPSEGYLPRQEYFPAGALWLSSSLHAFGAFVRLVEVSAGLGWVGGGACGLWEEWCGMVWWFVSWKTGGLVGGRALYSGKEEMVGESCNERAEVVCSVGV
ncbi:hypothetical protein P171DRAFT_262316 [Karstenula rhodostoma CBS 690.94]|uniref:Uncharacterized protein n=1 Tax=Karstenula rhodostoma CBS 690.94 TaxID=1392251 RepID=A0A9P4UEU5_9PLEO|nr:hypothetical protein P171DRAFT_262316 [Karstenula rhodostoma CBS 690.94]